jgi:hypothetical protein
MSRFGLWILNHAMGLIVVRTRLEPCLVIGPSPSTAPATPLPIATPEPCGGKRRAPTRGITRSTRAPTAAPSSSAASREQQDAAERRMTYSLCGPLGGCGHSRWGTALRCPIGS